MQQWRHWALAGWVALGLAAPLGAKAQVENGLFTVVEGRAQKQPGGGMWHKADVDTTVVGGDRVRTLLDSRAEMELAELDLVRLAPRTTLDVIKLYREMKTEQREATLHLESGSIWAKVAGAGPASRFAVATPISGAAITGTTLRIDVAADSTTMLKVYKGEVRVTNAADLGALERIEPRTLEPVEVPGPEEIPGPLEVTLEEWVYLLRAMQQIEIGPDRRVRQVGSFSATDPDEQTAWVRWNQERDRLGEGKEGR